jgi:DNA-binding MarR family transcriptional regulator
MKEIIKKSYSNRKTRDKFNIVQILFLSGMGSKLKSESNSDIRRKITSYIRMHPGTSFKTIKTIFNLSDGTLRYHLRYLEKKDKIRSEDNRRIYFPTGFIEKKDLSRTQQLLITTIKNNPGITQKELAFRTKTNRLTVRYNTKSLIDKELLSVIKMGKEIHHFFVSPEELEKTKMMRLITKFLLDKIDEETYWDLRNALVA